LLQKVCCPADAEIFPENPTEIKRVLETDGEGQIFDENIFFAQNPPRLFQSVIQQIMVERHSRDPTEENIQVKSQLKTVRKTKEKLEKEKEELTGKVQIASVILAKNIIITPLNKKGKEKNKIGKINKLRVCFTLRENPIAEAGYKTVYLRIQRPDSIILSGPEAVVFPVDETKLVCSAKREVEYLNKDLDMCIYWNNDGSLIPGKYNVYLYLEGYQIGQSSFLLK
jgi:hypothetical protein